MEPPSLEVPLSDEKSGKRRRGRRRRRRDSGGRNGAPKKQSPASDTEAVERAINRFNQNPPPMGVPAEINPPPERIDVTCKKYDEEKMDAALAVLKIKSELENIRKILPHMNDFLND